MKKTTPLLVLICLLIGIAVIDSCKKDPVIPTLTTSTLSNITINSVSSGGVITKDGGAAVTARGVCWGTSENPVATGSHTSDDSGIGSFVSNITGLTPNTMYHIRAYATNKAGTAYGDDISFTTTPVVVPTLTTVAVTSITLTTAVSGGNITADGNAAITAKGVCWATTPTPTISNSKTTDGTGNGSYVSNISGLQPATTYHLRSYATNSAGTAYGNEVSFLTSPILVPTLTTAPATSITLTTAVSGGNITSDGGGAVTAKGTCWATTANPTISDSKTSDGTGSGSFTSSLSGLVAGTTYHIRAYATNSIGTAYGDDLTFTTNPIVVATLTTTTPTSITLTTAVSGGNITADGGGTITDRGVCWATTADPTITNSKVSTGIGTGSFISNLTGLLPGTEYHVRAFATNSAGTSYGNDVSFTTTAIGYATLTTTAVTSITLTTAVSGGNVLTDGGGTVSARGVCWATTSNPTISDSKTTNSSGTGIFTSNLTGLSPATTYYVRAYATNSAGTAYGNEVSFTSGQIVVPTLTTTAVTSITLTTAVSGGNITNTGGGTISARGVCWALTTDPTTSNFITTNGSGSGSFASSLTSLTPGTTYYVRAYATNSAGTAYGNVLSFTTDLIVAPTLTTVAVTSITLTTAISGGTISSDGGGNITAKGVCWATTANPISTGSHTTDGTGSGNFASNLTSLLPSTTYHVRAYATNSAGTAYGNDISFTTSAVALATLSTTAVTSVTQTTASSGGNITADGGGAISARGICWAVTADPIASGSHTTDGTGTGSFTSSLTGLSAGTTYHVRAYATNSAGTAYGNDVSFTTSAALLPTLTTNAITSNAVTTAVSGGNITSDGGGTLSARGVCWATTSNPEASGSHTSDGTSTGSFSSNITGLSAGTRYYVRAYATNGAGTAYGNQVIFNTKVADIELNTYNTVTIGAQVWMAENLATTRFSNNSAIPNVTANLDWIGLSTAAYCWYNNDETTYKPMFGALYNWFAVNSGNLCPTGWHVPSDNEFNTLEGFLGLPADSLEMWGWRGTNSRLGEQLKSTTGWAAGENGTNLSGFSGLPAGYRYGIDGNFEPFENTYWWTSTPQNGTEAWYRRVDGNQIWSYRAAVVYQGGKYVRCLKD